MSQKKQLNEEELKEISLDDETLEDVSGGDDFVPVVNSLNTNDDSENLKGPHIKNR